jgi:RHS repeat-associated protein
MRYRSAVIAVLLFLIAFPTENAWASAAPGSSPTAVPNPPSSPFRSSHISPPRVAGRNTPSPINHSPPPRPSKATAKKYLGPSISPQSPIGRAQVQSSPQVANGPLAPDPQQNALLWAVSCSAANACTAVGYAQLPDGTDIALAQGWNGSSWSAQPVVNPNGDTTVVLEGVSCTAANACIAVGYHYGSYSQTLAEQWDGSSWTVMSSANFSSTTSNWLDSVSCTSANACIAAGYYYNSGYLTLTEQWNGSSWTLLTTPSPSNADSYLTGVSCSAAAACTAVGYYTNYGNNYQVAWETLAERWNGTAWTQQLPPNPSNGHANGLNSVSCPASNACTAVGSSTSTGTLAEAWNGTSWSVQTTPNASSGAPNYLESVSCTATSACTAVGYYYVTQQGPELTLAERWNGTSWTIQSTPNPSGSPSSQLWGVSCATASACAAVGRYYIPNSGNLAFAEQWNGSSWSGQYLQQSLSGGPITSSENPANNFCFPCFIRALMASMFVGDPVNPEFGDLTETATDVAIPGRGVPLAFTRTYDSLNAATNGPLGYGWTSNLFMSLSQPGGSGPVTITQEGGAQAVFNPNGSAYVPAVPRDIATLTHNGDGSWTFTRLAQNTYTFSSAGQLLSETDLNGYTTTLSYSSGQLTTITEPAGRTLTIGWTGSNITSVTDPNVSPARVVGYQYDGGGQLTDVIDVNGGHTHYGYDPAHHLTNLYDPNCYAAGNLCNAGNGVVIGYNASNQVSSQQDQVGRQTTFTYSGDPTLGAGGSTTITDPKLNVTVDSYQDGVRTAETKGYGTSKAATWSWTYDPTTGAPITATDPDGHTTTSSVDASGNVLATNDPLGRQTSATYNSLNEPLTKIDGNGVTTTYTYDAQGNLLTVSIPLVGTTQTKLTTYSYTDSSHPGDVTAMIDPDTNTWNYSYDGYGDRMTVADPLGHVATTCYNADGWTLAAYTPKAGSITCSNPPPSSPYETTYSYVQQGNGQTDEFGDVQAVTDPLGHVIAHTYDADRNLTSTTDGNGNPTTYVYDLANEQTDIRRADSTALHTDYNLDGTVLDQKDGKGTAIQTYGYDPLGRETTVTDTLSNTTTYAYDGAGNRLTQQDPGGNCGGAPPTGCTTMGYDADNELASVTYSDGVTPNVSNITYDKDGQRTGMTDGTGNSSWAWDSLRRITSFADGRGDTVQYQYNLRGLITQITYPAGVNVSRGYDIAGRWTSVADGLGNSFTFGYDANGNLTSSTLPSGTGEADGSTYNAADQLTAISDTQGPSTLFAAGYGRDGNGQVSSDNSLPAAVGSYRYTQLNQLCYAGSSNASACTAPPTGSQPYSLDAADNLTGNNGTTQAFNTADELCWSVPGSSGNACGSAPSGATSFGYNNRGDRTAVTPPTGSAASLGYDQANRLTSYAQGSTSATYKYNGDGLRMSKTVAGVTTPFTWDVSGVPLLISDGTYDYVYGPGGAVVEEFLAPTISMVGTVTASGKATSLRLTLPSGVQVNDQVIVASTQPSTTTVTAPSGYTQVATVTSGGTSPLAKTTVFRHAVATGDTSVTLTYSTGTTAQSVVLGVYRGVDPNQPIDVTAIASAAASTSVTAPSVTPTYASDRLLVFQGAVGTFSGSSWTAPTGTVERAQINATANVSSGLADQPIPSGATGSRSSAFGSSANLTAIEVTLAPVHTVILVGTATASGKATSLALTLPSGVQVNDQVVLASTQPSTTTVTAPSGYTQVATVTSGGSAPLATTTVFRHTVVSGDSSVTLTYSTSSTAQAAALAVYRNVNPSQPVDVTATGSAAASTTVVGPSVTTTNSGDQLLVFQGAVGTFSGSSWTAPSGTTERAQINATANASTGLADQILGAAGATGTRTSTFGRTANLTSVMVALAQPLSLPAIFFLHQDQLGSTRMLTDGAGVIKGTSTYDPYGNLTAITGSATTPFGFSGQYRDAETGFLYLRARYYDPATAEFITSDPAVASTRSPYAYVSDNPQNASDPTGLFCLEFWDTSKCLNPYTGARTGQYKWGVGASASADAGAGPVGGGGGSVGFDTWHGGPGSSKTNGNTVPTATYGGFVRGPSTSAHPFALGGQCSIGGHVTLTNTGDIKNIYGKFHNVNLNFGAISDFSLNLAWSDNGTVIIQPGAGLGFGLSASAYDTNTVPGG